MFPECYVLLRMANTNFKGTKNGCVHNDNPISLDSA